MKQFAIYFDTDDCKNFKQINKMIIFEELTPTYPIHYDEHHIILQSELDEINEYLNIRGVPKYHPNGSLYNTLVRVMLLEIQI